MTLIKVWLVGCHNCIEQAPQIKGFCIAPDCDVEVVFASDIDKVKYPSIPADTNLVILVRCDESRNEELIEQFKSSGHLIVKIFGICVPLPGSTKANHPDYWRSEIQDALRTIAVYKS